MHIQAQKLPTVNAPAGTWEALPLEAVPSPCYILHRGLLERNARKLHSIHERTGATVLLALKGFAAWGTFPCLKPYLAGTAASGIHEALLGREHFGGEVHAYSPAYTPHEIERLLHVANHMTFNSLRQWARFREQVRASGRGVACGLRINPEYSEVETELYNPCAAGSRLGITRGELDRQLSELGKDALEGISGLHFHTLCEQGADTLARTLEAVEAKFGDLLGRLEWLNIGGGHHITREDYDTGLLCERIKDLQERRGLRVILEPGEALALGTGVLAGTVLDTLENSGINIAVLDVSATAHMPDVLEMPYRPEILGAGEPGEHPHLWRLGGPTCLAGDIAGDWSFPEALEPGRRIVFLDMAQYTMVKTTTFNGVPLPAIALYHPERGEMELLRRFGYEDYKERLS